jgi:hypothetical protein
MTICVDSIERNQFVLITPQKSMNQLSGQIQYIEMEDNSKVAQPIALEKQEEKTPMKDRE